MSKKRMTLEVNSEIRDILSRNLIPIQDGISYLLCLYYGTVPSFIPQELERRVLATNIVTKDYKSDDLKWNVGLFEEQETGFEWIGEWMDLFKAINPERRGTKADVLRRMKRFFVNNPSIRKEEVFEATNNYLSSVSDPIYCKKSHKFIYEIDGTSMLLDFVQNIETKKNNKISENDEFI